MVNTVSHRTALFLLGPQLKERTWNSVSKGHVCHVLSKVMGVGKVDKMTFASEVFRFVQGDNVIKYFLMFALTS